MALGRFLFHKVWNIQLCMLPSYGPWFTGFRTVFVFVVRPFLPMWVLLVSDLQYYIGITMGTPHKNFSLAITGGSYWPKVWAAFCMIFSGIPHSTIFGSPEYAYHIWPYLAYLLLVIECAKYGQVRYPWKDRPKSISGVLTPQSKVIAGSNFGATSPL